MKRIFDSWCQWIYRKYPIQGAQFLLRYFWKETYFTKKGFGHNHHFFHFDIEEGGLESIIKVKPKLIISALRGPFEALIETHQFLIDLIDRSNCRLIFLSSANVFDTFEHFPCYEYDKTLSESIYGRFKIKIENDLLRLPLPSLFWPVCPWYLEIIPQEFRNWTRP